MKHLFKEWDNIKNQLNDKEIFLFLDYDGTLAPISNSPEKALLPIKTRKLLEKLSESPFCEVAIVSGRSVLDLKQMVQLKNIIYIGNHGLEIKDRLSLTNILQPKEIRYALWDSYKRLYDDLRDISGIIIENKKFTLSVHYRMVATNFTGKVKHAVKKIMEPHLIKGTLKINYGKKVIEIKPPGNWNKGSAARHLLSNKNIPNNIIPICIGDDITDEDLFLALKGNGLTIRVGKPALSHATYYIESIIKVQKLLDNILLLINSRKLSV